MGWADMFYELTLPTYLRKPHLLPKLPAAFRDATEAYAAEVKVVVMKILNLIATALNMKGEDIETVFEEGMQSMRMNYYPPCPEPELVTGLCPHSDAIAGLTILLQLNEMEVLQIKKDGAWIPVSPLPNAFVINIGDILEVYSKILLTLLYIANPIVTNGSYRSIEHRAIVNSKKNTSLSPHFTARNWIVI
ncbi:hypothetical protein BUALT_Bualt01G0161700 [Buddleja alternifolia]|uniref:Fe2OG dioxygenase domain-containing protein n=1 Tax=Buddleja alternifolia TaxID=168488 RepID=A0AAV6Y975_9LAMI|nr:hypothetical protein BUALT_Bualt01G0161700 [Buddleja alternifolia]